MLRFIIIFFFVFNFYSSSSHAELLVNTKDGSGIDLNSSAYKVVAWLNKNSDYLKETNIHFNFNNSEDFHLNAVQIITSELYDRLGLEKDKLFESIFGWSVKINSKNNPFKDNSFRFRSLYSLSSNRKELFNLAVTQLATDNQFSCKLPSVAKYIRGILKVNKTISSFECDKGLPYVEFVQKKLIKKIKYINLDKVHSVQFFFATQSKQIASRFGHAMLKIVLCSEKRTSISDKCLTDFSDHLILSFRAATGLEPISAMKGLNGQYPMQIYFMNQDTAMREYNLNEQRDLHGYTLNVSNDDKLMIVKRVIESYWQYSGRYYFTSQNCATELLSLLRSSLQRKNTLKDSPVTPIGLKNLLLKEKLISPINEKDDRFYFKSYEAKLSLSNEILKGLKLGNNESNIDLASLNREDRILIANTLITRQQVAAFQIAYELFYDNQHSNEINKVILHIKESQQTQKLNEIKELEQAATNGNYTMHSITHSLGIPMGREIREIESKFIQLNIQLSELINERIKSLAEEKMEIRLILQQKNNSLTNGGLL
jgi:hypothetical protein